MDLTLTQEQLAFRDEVRQFLEKNVSEEVRQKTFNYEPLTKEERIQWQKALYQQGWGAPSSHF